MACRGSHNLLRPLFLRAGAQKLQARSATARHRTRRSTSGACRMSGVSRVDAGKRETEESNGLSLGYDQ